MVVKRTCPECGAEQYSANSKDDWVCECGCFLNEELNKLPETKDRDAVDADD